MGRTVEARPLGPTQGGSTRAVPWLPAQEVEWQRHRLHKHKESNQHQDMRNTRQTGGNHKVPSVVWRVSHGGLSLGGDRIPQEVPHLGSTEVRRNHKRGLRNKESIERRKLARSQKRWKLRKDKRKSKHQGGTSRPPREAQDPGRTNIQKLSIGQDLKIATLNLRGLKQAGKREEVERWMEKNGIDILGTQETHISQNNKERRKNYTWYLNGNEEGEREFAGVAWVISNKLNKYISDVIPHNSRVTELRIEGTAPIFLMNIYAPQSGRPKEEKEQFYQELRSLIKNIPNKWPFLLIGDWNAKLQEPDNEEEAQWIGGHTFDKGASTTWTQAEGTEENREALLDLCREFTLTPCNTRFPKPPHKLATWKAMSTTKENPWDRQHYDQIDYILVPKRWQNGIQDAESDMAANIDSDHAPVWVKCRFKLKQINKKENTRRLRIEPLEEEQKEAYNKELIDQIKAQQGGITYQSLCKILKETVPKHFQLKKNTARNKEWSQETETLLERRSVARAEGDWDKANDLNKQFRASLKKDKTKHLLDTFREDLDLRSKWMGIRQLRKGYAPAPYHRKNQGGQHIPMGKRAEEAA